MIKKNNDNYSENNNLSIKNGNQSELTPLPAKQRLFLSIIDKLTAFSMIWVSMVLMYGVILHVHECHGAR